MKSQDIIYSLSLNFNASENDFNGTFLSYLEFVRSVVQFFRRTVQANLRQLFQFINYYLKIKVLNLSISIWRKIAILFSQQVLFAKTDFLSTDSNLKFRGRHGLTAPLGPRCSEQTQQGSKVHKLAGLKLPTPNRVKLNKFQI